MSDQIVADQDLQKVKLGFWIYLMTDCLLFASMFATFAVLRNNTAGGEPLSEMIIPPYVLTQTLILLVSSYTCNLALQGAVKNSARSFVAWLTATIILGGSFLVMELMEFGHLASEGNSWQENAALSSFFTLVGTHGLHILIGLSWAGLLMWLVAKHGITKRLVKKVQLFGMYWHFLDVIWVCIFAVVYMRGIM